jgi:hypothetical protein
MWACAQTDPWRRCADRFYALLIIHEPVRQIPYPPALSALSTLCRTITTNSLIPVTPLMTTVLGDVAVPLSTIPKGQSRINPVQ